MNDKTVLVVEDRGNTLKVISAILEDEGYRVFKATGGRQALEIYIANEDIQVVLSDLRMPEMDGLALFRQMQAVRRPPPFIIMTAYGTVKSAVQALKEGVTNYLIKPLDYEELVIVLEKAVHDHSLSQELKALKASIHQFNINSYLFDCTDPQVSSTLKASDRYHGWDVLCFAVGNVRHHRPPS